MGVFSWSWAVPTGQNQIIESTKVVREAKEALERRTEVIDPSVAGVRAEDPAAVNAKLTSVWKTLGLESYLLLTWACGAIVCGAYVAAIWLRHLRAIRKTSTPPTNCLTTLCQRVGEKIGLKRRVRLLISSESYGPSCFGVFRPSVVLPEQLVTNVLNENIEPVLAHELIHIRRGDTLIALLQVLAGVVWWFHPLIWLISRQMTREREKCCDEEVVAGTACDPEEYAQGILEVLKLNRPIEPAILMNGIWSVDVTKERLEAIMSRSTKLHSRTPWFCWGVFAIALLAALPGQHGDYGWASADQPANSGGKTGPKAPAGDGDEWARLSPFADVIIRGEVVEVKFRGKMYILLSIDDLPTKDILDSSRKQFGELWEKRFVEDLVEVLESLGHKPGKTVKLRLADIITDEVTTVDDALMSQENRRSVYIAHNRRVQKRKSPWYVDREPVRNLITDFVKASRDNDQEAVSRMLDAGHGPERTENYVEDTRKMLDAKIGLTQLGFVEAVGNRAIAATDFFHFAEGPMPHGMYCVVYHCVRQGDDWVISDIDLEDLEGFSQELVRFVEKALENSVRE